MKIIRIIGVVFVIIIMLTPQVLAAGDIFSTAENWISTGKEHAGIGIDTPSLQTGANKIYNILLAVATVVAVIVGAILGIQFMMAGVNEKVKVKESLFPYIISCIVVFGAMGIWKLIVVLAGDIM